MNAEIFAEWLRRQGCSVIRTDSSYWYEAGPRVYQAFPYHWLIQPTELELLSLFRQKRAVALRYSAPLENPFGFISYHAVYDECKYTIDGLDRRSRQNIRKGLKKCEIEPISFERLARDGWLLEMDTAKRQERRLTISEAKWRRRYMAAKDLPGFEAWGALVDGRLAASLFTFKIEDCCQMISQQCHRDFLRARVNNALGFVVTKNMVDSTEVRSIFYTLQSLNAPESVDQFKFRMGYKPKPVRQRVVFHSLLSPILNRAMHVAVRQLCHHLPKSSFLGKMEGMLRFYLKGKYPPENQDWPKCLCERKNRLLKIMQKNKETVA